MTFPSDIEISNKADIQHITQIAKKLNIPEEDLELYGKYKAKLPLKFKQDHPKKGKLILVTAITPTPSGEGKTTVSIGLADGLNKIGKQATAVLREPSLGPVFGIKGGAAGGGYSQVIPMEDINLHFTGDFSAIEKANNLLSAAIDNNLQSRKRTLHLDTRTITWKRVMDMNDRSLRQIVVGVGSGNGIAREDGFNITPASEIMAILCLAEDFNDLKERLGNIYIGDNFEREPIFARDLNIVGAMAILLKDAIKPNLVQTLEGNPAIIHGGPFASIAQGTNSVIATKTGLSLSDYVVTEAGFGADLGAEKFLNIKCRSAELTPQAVVVVATVRALRHHGGAAKEDLQNPDLEKLKKGFPNLEKHIENVQSFDLEPVVAINYFPNDSQEEIDYIISKCAEKNIKAIVSKGFAEGGEGMKELAVAVAEVADAHKGDFRYTYEMEDDLKEKIAKVAKNIYGATSIAYEPRAERQIRSMEKKGFDKLPICMVKTPMSLSDDHFKRGRPENFEIIVREFEISSGAGFVIPILADTMRMPGLPTVPAAESMDIDENGVITGLS